MPNTKFSNWGLRIISGLFIGLVFIIAIVWLNSLYYATILLIGIGMFVEWYNMTYLSRDFYLGLIIIPLPILSLIMLKYTSKNYSLLLLYFITIFAVDTFAMVGGKLLRGPKLAPILSPNKTWSGLLSGIIAAAIIANLLTLIPDFDLSAYKIFDHIDLITWGIVSGILGQLSDLFISYFKRKFKVKDAGMIIPGHGGLLDRFDSIILTAPTLLAVLLLFQQ